MEGWMDAAALEKRKEGKHRLTHRNTHSYLPVLPSHPHPWHIQHVSSRPPPLLLIPFLPPSCTPLPSSPLPLQHS